MIYCLNPAKLMNGEVTTLDNHHAELSTPLCNSLYVYCYWMKHV